MLVINLIGKKRLKEKSTKKEGGFIRGKEKNKKVESCVQDLRRLVYHSVLGTSMKNVGNTNVCFSRCR